MKTKKLLGRFFSIPLHNYPCRVVETMKSKKYILCHLRKDIMSVLCWEQKISPLRGGNRDYTVTVQNTKMFLSMDIDLSSPIDMGNLVVKPKQKEKPPLLSKDNVTNETVDLKIKIVDSYLNLKVTHPAQITLHRR